MTDFFTKFQFKKYAPLILIVLVGAYLRLYRHDDFLHFELDQARDAILVSEAIINGPGELPLLGPRAAGTNLRLGPIFYYLEYAGALLFGNTPAAMDALFVFLATGAIGLCYWFLKKYFESVIALLTTAVFSVSLFLVTYGKFAWNPNALSFFGFIFLIGLWLLAAKPKSPSGFYLLALGLGIGIQLHFLVFLAYPATMMVFLIWKWFSSSFLVRDRLQAVRRFLTNKHFWLALLLIVMLNLPVLVNEKLTGGNNLKELWSAIGEKSEKGEKYNWGENLTRNLQEYAGGYWLMITGSQKSRPIEVDWGTVDSGVVEVTCQKDCRDGLGALFGGLVFFLGGMGLLIGKVFGLLKKKDSVSVGRRDFLALNLILLAVLFWGFLPSAFKFPPRFLLASVPVCFVFLALWLDFLRLIGKKLIRTGLGGRSINFWSFLIPVILTLVLVLGNLWANGKRFKEQADAHLVVSPSVERDLVLKEDFRFTLYQQQLIVDWMLVRSEKEMVFVLAPAKYYRPLIYLLTYQKGKIGRVLGSKPSCLEADFFAVLPTVSGSDSLNKEESFFTILEQEIFGTFTVYRLGIEKLPQNSPSECAPKKETSDLESGRYLWREAWQELKR